MELEPSAHVVLPAADHRPLIPEPLPVRLLTVDDATLHAAAGLEVQLDEFYVGLLKFEREESDEPIYRADNFRLRFSITETFPERDNLRPLLIEVPRLSDLEHAIIDRKLDYTRQRGVTLGEERLILQDPAGNWVEIVEFRGI